MDDEIKKKFAELEAKLATVEAELKKVKADTIWYINQHSDVHIEMDKMLYPAYCRTHPEYRDTMDQYYQAVEGKSKDRDGQKS